MFRRKGVRLLPLVLGAISLGAGLWTSLGRLGLPVEGVASINHGPLMVGGFTGTVIAFERAVALGRPWGYLAPALSALGALLLALSQPHPVAAVPLFLASLVLLAEFAVFFRRQPAGFTAVMAAGALAWAVGNGMLIGGRILPDAVPWWAAFLILTVAGERIEMSRIRRSSPTTQSLLYLTVAGYLAALVWGLFDGDSGTRAGGLAVIALAAALARNDVARHTVRGAGLARYAATGILSGYFWLIVSGVLAVVFGRTIGGLHYDAWTHAQFVGFVLVMIMAHAPIILPAVAGLPVRFTAAFFVPFALLHTSLAARIAADLALSWHGRQWTGLLNVTAVLLFAAVLVRSVLRGRRDRTGDLGTRP